MKNLASPAVIKEILISKGFNFSKSWGQNFLIDENVLCQMIESSAIDQNTCVLEIGPGFGTLTQRLCMNAKKVVSVEIDPMAVEILKENLSEFDNFDVINADIMKTDIKKLINDEFGDQRVKVVANLPYYITTPVIMALLDKDLPIDDIIVMIQKEVAQRIAAIPGNKDYGALTLAVNLRAESSLLVTVPPSSFIPQPKVSSAVIGIHMLDKPKVDLQSEEKFFAVVKAAFGQRRKTLLNALTNNAAIALNKEQVQAVLEKSNIDGRRRGETLSMQEFADIANNL